MIREGHRRADEKQSPEEASRSVFGAEDARQAVNSDRRNLFSDLRPHLQSLDRREVGDGAQRASYMGINIR